MALRFRRSFRLAPGLRLNLTGGGASLSVGPRGASVNFGRRGTFFNTGIPGTGLYARTRVAGSPPSRVSASSAATQSIRVSVGVEDDGTVTFLDANSKQPLSKEWIARAKRQMGDEIRTLIQDTCDAVNAKVEALGRIHLQTPAPHDRLRYEPLQFIVRPPAQPIVKPHGFLSRLFESTRARIDAENARRQAEFEKAMSAWKSAKAAFDETELLRNALLEERVFNDVAAMEEILERALKAIEWPRETAVSAEVDDGGRVVLLDVDLPEIEDMPRKAAAVPAKGYRLNIKEMPAAKVRKLYMAHVHGIGFRIVGEVFAVLPSAQDMVLSAFSQRANKATGSVTDEYLYSVRVKRDDWTKIDFGNLQALDVVTALERFELRRQLDRSGAFSPIEPLSLGTAVVRHPVPGDKEHPRVA